MKIFLIFIFCLSFLNACTNVDNQIDSNTEIRNETIDGQQCIHAENTDNPETDCSN